MKDPYDMYVNGLIYKIILPLFSTSLMVMFTKAWITTVIFFTLIYCIDEIFLKSRLEYISENKTYRENIFKIDINNANTIKMINRYFLFYNGQNAEMIDKEEIEIAVSYTTSQNFFYTLFNYGIPVFEIMDLIYENLDKNLISYNDTENIFMDEDIFIDEKSNYLRQSSTKMKYGLSIGNLILCDKIHKVLEKVYKRSTYDESVSDIQKNHIEKEIIEYFHEIREFTQYETEFIKYKNMTDVSKKPILSKTDNIEWLNKFMELKKKLDEALKNNEKTMIYSNYVEKGTYLLEIFFNSVFEQKYLDKILFLVSPDTKEGRSKNSELLKKFNNNNADIIVFHPDIMEGVSLTECMHVHILVYIHQPAKYEQVIARARRNKSHQIILSKNPQAKLKIYKYIIQDNQVLKKTMDKCIIKRSNIRRSTI